jgi:hypothetical protein
MLPPHLDFGPPYKVRYIRPAWRIVDAFEADDGTLYIAYHPPLPNGTVAGEIPLRLAVLGDEGLSNIPTPVDHVGLGFIGSLYGRPVVDASIPSGRYVIVGLQANSLSESVRIEENLGDRAALNDGSLCEPATDNSGVAIYEVSGQARRPLITARALGIALHRPVVAHGLSLRCFSFAGRDFVQVNDNTVLLIQRGELIPWAAVRELTTGKHQLLLISTSGPTTYIVVSRP